MLRLTIRIDLGQNAFGPGKAKLLEAVAAQGSIRSAAASLGMSYRRAWLLIKDIEAMTGAPVVNAATGGARGGGASLSALGQRVLERYRAVEKAAARSAADQLRAFGRTAKGRSVRQRARGRQGSFKRRNSRS